MSTNQPAPKRRLSEEHRRKMSISRRGKKLSEEHRRKISEGLKGRVFSEETRRKISESNRGLTRSEETRSRISEARRGTKASEEHRKNMSIALSGRTKSGGRAANENFIGALVGKVRDPSGKVWDVVNVNHFVRTHRELFTEEELTISHGGHCPASVGIGAIARSGKSGRSTWKGWSRVIPPDDESHRA